MFATPRILRRPAIGLSRALASFAPVAALETVFLDLVLRLASAFLRRAPDRYLTFYRALLALKPPVQAGVRVRLWRCADERLTRILRADLDDVRDFGRACRLNTLINNFETSRGLDTLKSRPQWMSLEPTTGCNLRCPMCTHAVLDAPAFSLDLDVLERCEPAFRNAHTVNLGGWGEALVYRDLGTLVGRVSRPGRVTTLSTNGLLLSEKVSRLLVENRLTRLLVSLDAVRRETFEAIRGVDGLDTVLGNLRRLNEIKREMGIDQPDLYMGFVMMRRNIDQLPEMVQLAVDLGFRQVRAMYLDVHSEDMREQSLFYEPERANRYIAEARKVAARLGIPLDTREFNLEKMRALREADRPAIAGARYESVSTCRLPWQFTMLSCIGTVLPCCTDNTILGDVREEPFDAIWNGPQYRAYRRGLIDGHPLPPCRNCFEEGYKTLEEEMSHIHIVSQDGTFQRDV